MLQELSESIIFRCTSSTVDTDEPRQTLSTKKLLFLMKPKVVGIHIIPIIAFIFIVKYMFHRKQIVLQNKD